MWDYSRPTSLQSLLRVVIKEVLNHAILNKGNQCYHESEQLLLYIRGEEEVRKSRFVKAIYLGFGFFKRQKELLIVALISAATANIGGAIIHRVLSI